MAIGREVWNTIVNDPFIPTVTNEDGVVVPKSEAQWTSDEDTKRGYDWKSQNVLIFALGMEEYYSKREELDGCSCVGNHGGDELKYK
jgi:hypothetical protein